VRLRSASELLFCETLPPGAMVVTGGPLALVQVKKDAFITAWELSHKKV